MSEEYIKGARYRVTFEGEWDGQAVMTDDGYRCYKGGNLRCATSIEKIADPTPEWLPGDKVLRNEGRTLAVYRGDDSWDVYYGPTREPLQRPTSTALSFLTAVLVKQGKVLV